MISIVGPNPHQVSYQNLLDFSRLRKQEFVDRLGWDLTHTESAEWDEYDNPNALYAIAYENGKCVGGARLLRTDKNTPRKGSSDLTFMLADFLAGRLSTSMSDEDMKATISPSPEIWEMTRFVGSPKVTKALLGHVNGYLALLGAHSVLTLSPRLMPIALKRLGYSVNVLSKPIEFDGKEYVALQTLIQQRSVRNTRITAKVPTKRLPAEHLQAPAEIAAVL
ncbi:autoinducer synthesis protein RhlL [Roseobacter sp. SK209-2-6]|uniref:acyl-homoserine-lactone synthase n=1 Tax=Roseobacter sp. SK209-2-6 TaxID=388739 RepID=UPI0000F3F332|nr:acyl-homoserine-lactone synthase [Roseobacter sp. SK209-2-6]EBA16460.1 autoinducer synthesis protein RhlL [Roseobacter sp. SK209-2-6]